VRDRVQSWSAILAGAAVVALLGWVTLGRQRGRDEPEAVATSAADASAVTARANADGSAPSGSGAGALALAPIESGDSGLSLIDTITGDAGALPSGAPRSVKLGVVLVQFVGAEGAPAGARTKAAAMKLALEVARQGKADWKAAVRAGDSGSSEDIGRIPRGVLDNATEVAVFSLATGEISEPLETPRGFWVVKRNE
jgi:hypothetical protein